MFINFISDSAKQKSETSQMNIFLTLHHFSMKSMNHFIKKIMASLHHKE